MKKLFTVITLVCCCVLQINAQEDWSTIAPLFSDNGCTGCHGNQGGLSLTSYAGIAAGGNKCGTNLLTGTNLVGSIITTGYDGCGSPISAPSMNDRVGGLFDQDELDRLQAWVDNGAPEVFTAVPGCTDEAATNYDPAATEEDGTCLYLCSEDNLLDVSNSTAFDGGSGNSFGSPNSMGLLAGANNDFGGFLWNVNTDGLGIEDICMFIDMEVIADASVFPITLEFRIENNGCGFFPCPWYDFNTVINESGTYTLGGLVAEANAGGNGPFDPAGDNPALVVAIAHFTGSPLNSDITVNFGNLCVSNGNCNAQQECPNGDIVGAACDDMDDCTVDDTVLEDCTCEGTFLDTDNDGICDADETLGCTDMAASNFNPEATSDDGSCLYLCEDGNPLGIVAVQDFNDGSGLSYGTQNGMGLLEGANDAFGGFIWNLNTAGFLEEDICMFMDMEVSGDPEVFPITLEFRIENGECGFFPCPWTDFNMEVSGPGTYTFGGVVLEGNTGANGPFDPNGDNPAIIAAIANFSGTPLAGDIDIVFSNLCVTLDCNELPGCTDPAACNYDVNALVEDGSCEYPEEFLDCDGNCLNDADADGICDELESGGCTDETACNYDPDATDDDGSCTYAEEFLDCDGNCLNDTDGDGVCDELEVSGCTDASACNFDEAATDDDGSCSYSEEFLDCDGNCLNDADNDGICDEFEEGGCTDETACNYDPDATEDNGTCTYAEPNLNCDGSCINDSDGDGVCDEFEVAGCNDASACNFDELATDNDGSCTYAEEFLDCEGNCLNDADNDGICDEFEAGGCTDPMACNYDASATEDNGTCTYAEPNLNCDGSCINDSDGDGVCDEFEINGCPDPAACNYDATATENDGSCVFAEAFLDCDGNCLNDADNDGICDELEAGGCTDPMACNYDASATDDNGTCTYAEPNLNCDGSCINDADSDGICDEFESEGCTDPMACNFDANATDDNGSCTYAEPNLNCDGSCINDADGDGVCDEFEIAGCTDMNADNFNPAATDEDGSCAYDDLCQSFAMNAEIVCSVGGIYQVFVVAVGGTGNFVVDDGTGPMPVNDINGEIFVLFGPYDQGEAYNITVTDAIAGCTAQSSGTVDCSTTAIELLSFEANAEERGNVLSWKTATENNNDHFNVMKSTDGVQFEKIAVIDGAGNSNTIQAYNYTDEDLINTVVYYRIDAFDTDGSSTLSNIVKVVRDDRNTLTISPVPANEFINIELVADKSDSANLTIYDVSGKVVRIESLELSNGKQIIPLDITELSSGIYFLAINGKTIDLKSSFIVK